MTDDFDLALEEETKNMTNFSKKIFLDGVKWAMRNSYRKEHKKEIEG